VENKKGLDRERERKQQNDDEEDTGSHPGDYPTEAPRKSRKTLPKRREKKENKRDSSTWITLCPTFGKSEKVGGSAESHSAWMRRQTVSIIKKAVNRKRKHFGRSSKRMTKGRPSWTGDPRQVSISHFRLN